MTPSVDLLASSLLCAEECYYDDDDDDDGVVVYDECLDQNIYEENESFVFMDLEKDLPLYNDESLTSSTLKESQQFVGVDDYFLKLKNENMFLVARQQAVDWISKVHAQFNFGPLCAYLSVNYLDRFLAVYELPKDQPWMVQLLAVTCLSLAAKIDETEMPLDLDLQAGESRYIFEAKTIQRMELIVMSTLNWRMQSGTPFSFIDSFIGKIINDENGQSQMVSRYLILKSTQMILSLIKGIDYLEFQPSEIAAAVAISVVGIEVEKTQISAIFDHAKKERVLKCMEVLIKSCNMSFGSSTMRPLPESPIGLLDAATLSYKNDDSSTCAKRRRLNNIII